MARQAISSDDKPLTLHEVQSLLAEHNYVVTSKNKAHASYGKASSPVYFVCISSQAVGGRSKKQWYAKGDEACGHVLLDIAVMILAHEQQTQYVKIQNANQKTETS